MKNQLYTLEEVVVLIEEGKLLSVAGDEKLLSQLPKGKWIGGTIPYFMTKEKGLFSKDMIFVNELSNFENEFVIKEYDENSIQNIVEDAYENGFTMLIIPPFQKIHSEFALKSQEIEGLFNNPITGWVSGMDLNSADEVPQVFDGTNLKVYADKAIAVHVKLPANKIGSLEIVNIFEQDVEGDKIEFLEDGFDCGECLINGERKNLAEYIGENKVDIRFPLVSNYSGAKINVSFQEVSEDRVKFYAPIFKETEYNLALPIDDYVSEFDNKIPEMNNSTEFSCNCILNYLHGELEGRKIENFTGPMTFGEIGYQLLNQTLTTLVISDSE